MRQNARTSTRAIVDAESRSAARWHTGIIGFEDGECTVGAFGRARIVATNERRGITGTVMPAAFQVARPSGAAANFHVATFAGIVVRAFDEARVSVGALDGRIATATAGARALDEAIETSWANNHFVFACVVGAALTHARTEGRAWYPRRGARGAGGRFGIATGTAAIATCPAIATRTAAIAARAG